MNSVPPARLTAMMSHNLKVAAITVPITVCNHQPGSQLRILENSWQLTHVVNWPITYSGQFDTLHLPKMSKIVLSMKKDEMVENVTLKSSTGESNDIMILCS